MRLSRIIPFASLLIATTARCQTSTMVGVPTYAFNYVASLQEDRDWCWAASSQMILKWFGVEVSQRAVVHRIRGRSSIQSASAKEITEALNGVAKVKSGAKTFIHAISSPGPPNPLVIVDELSQQIPMLLTLDSGANIGHAVVLTAASYYKDKSGIHITSLTIRDPYPSPENVRNGGRIEIAGPALRPFVSCINRTWMVWVTRR